MDSGLPPRAPRLWACRPCSSTTLRPMRTRQEFPVHPVSGGDRPVPVACPIGWSAGILMVTRGQDAVPTHLDSRPVARVTEKT